MYQLLETINDRKEFKNRTCPSFPSTPPLTNDLPNTLPKHPRICNQLVLQSERRDLGDITRCSGGMSDEVPHSGGGGAGHRDEEARHTRLPFGESWENHKLGDGGWKNHGYNLYMIGTRKLFKSVGGLRSDLVVFMLVG